jgi:glycosyltransferase A (GT-A) superfamily protein (DUF2064 family)
MQLKSKNNNMLLFVKYLKNGRGKTRLAKSIGVAAAVSLYKCFVEDILSSLQGLNAHIWICYYPESAKDDMAVWRFLRPAECHGSAQSIKTKALIGNIL